MPEIIVTAAPNPGRGDRDVTLRERVNAADFESDRFAANLLERLEWAVEDALELELERRGRITGRVLSTEPESSTESRATTEPEPDHDQAPEPAGIA